MASVLCVRRNFAVLVIILAWSDFSSGDNEVGKVLSRKRRHLLFPEGSSLQLVYDFTVPISYSQTIFVFSTTAALAWMLPSTIEEFQKGFFSKKFYKVPSNRIDIGKTKLVKTEFTKLKTKYYNEFGHDKPYEKYTTEFNDRYRPRVDYKPQFIRFGSYESTLGSSPAYRQSLRRKYNNLNKGVSYGSYNNNTGYTNNFYRPVRNYYRPMTSYYRPVTAHHRPVTTYVNPAYNVHHRRTGRDLFKKIEKFLNAQKKDGRTCVLKAICEVNDRSAYKKGTFTEEILKSIFRFNPSHDGESDVYDNAAGNFVNCSDTYPCNFSIWDVI